MSKQRIEPLDRSAPALGQSPGPHLHVPFGEE